MITAANAFVQMSVAPEMRGRVMALYMAIFMGGTPIGAPILGWVAEHFGARWTLVGGGALTVVGTIVSTCCSPTARASTSAPACAPSRPAPDRRSERPGRHCAESSARTARQCVRGPIDSRYARQRVPQWVLCAPG